MAKHISTQISDKALRILDNIFPSRHRQSGHQVAFSSGFTIVELLVVIVVIGILATITIVSYTGITSRANASALQSDLDNASKQLKLYQAEHSVYPSSLNVSNCPLDASSTPDNTYCLKPGSGITYKYSVDNTLNPKAFSLYATKNNNKYFTTDNATPAPTTQVSATGGTVTSLNGYNIHTFTTSGTFTVTGGGNVEVLVIAGGGGGANTGSGGGAGGYIFNNSLAVSIQSYSITIGAGGSGGSPTGNPSPGAKGGNSIFSTLIAEGGGYGVSHGGMSGGNGGSGGGGSINISTIPAAGGAGSQGNYGGAGYPAQSSWVGGSGGGGGAGSVGSDGTNSPGSGNGGAGMANSISGSVTYYAGGGAGSEVNGNYVGIGGTGGGGDAVKDAPGNNGIVNTGGGGAGGAYNAGIYCNGGNGGSGIVIIRYPN